MTQKKRICPPRRIVRAGLLAVLIVAALCVNAQNIYTVAGSGLPGYTGDGGPATTARISPFDFVATDPSGNLYFGSYQNTIRKIDAGTGIITTFAGNETLGYSGDGGPATAAQLDGVWGIASDAAGNIYCSDQVNGVVRMVNTSGIISTFAGNGSNTYSGDGNHATLAGLSFPAGVSVDASGNVYISTIGDSRVRVVVSGYISTFAGNGTSGFSGNGGLAVSAEMSEPTGICFDPSGNFYIADRFNDQVRSVTSGVINAFCGNHIGGYSGDGGSATSAEVIDVDVKADNSGNVYISDDNNRIRFVNPAGIVQTFAGGGTSLSEGVAATAASINPFGIAVDACGNLYEADLGNYKIRIICNAAVSVSISASSTSICSGIPITFSASGTSTGCPPAYTWYKTGSSTPLGTGATFIDVAAANGDAIYCVATLPTNAINSVCGVPTATSNVITLTVNPSPQITDVDINTRCIPANLPTGTVPTYSVTVTGGTGSYSYNWAPVEHWNYSHTILYLGSNVADLSS